MNTINVVTISKLEEIQAVVEDMVSNNIEELIVCYPDNLVEEVVLSFRNLGCCVVGWLRTPDKSDMGLWVIRRIRLGSKNRNRKLKRQ